MSRLEYYFPARSRGTLKQFLSTRRFSCPIRSHLTISMKPPETSIIVPVVNRQINPTAMVLMKPKIPANLLWSLMWKARAVWLSAIAVKPRRLRGATAPITSENGSIRKKFYPVFFKILLTRLRATVRNQLL